ncbi:hypothetical protein [Bradyrhizobium sp. CB3481]|uniref:hypothetical protein n=1 Tax=Bradyrhizobium sp. CB3481 TaxID=3039158 RepID=UPI0024B0DEEC|nr:hypothetical protein [Bradyrhizobium sp. CB3481]WFU20782.1 hypothetical protein QA643_26480 [Bradyrhizobium sp. CB3481]
MSGWPSRTISKAASPLLRETKAAKGRFGHRIATYILAFEGESHVEWFEGNFQDYQKDKMRHLDQDSIIPHRVKYKKLTR